jgi:hypothetical protein
MRSGFLAPTKNHNKQTIPPRSAVAKHPYAANFSQTAPKSPFLHLLKPPKKTKPNPKAKKQPKTSPIENDRGITCTEQTNPNQIKQSQQEPTNIRSENKKHKIEGQQIFYTLPAHTFLAEL